MRSTGIFANNDRGQKAAAKSANQRQRHGYQMIWCDGNSRTRRERRNRLDDTGSSEGAAE
jgi:hypothetical protein